MGLLDFFKGKPAARTSLEQLSYNIAYQILPHYVFRQAAQLFDIVGSSSETSHFLFYHLACKSQAIPSLPEQAEQYHWHQFDLDTSHTLLVLAYPQPAAIDLTGKAVKEMTQNVGTWVIAPHFSGIVRSKQHDHIRYYVLGQTSMGGGTVLREIDDMATNANLGAGPAPELDNFVALMRQRLGESE
ncbi:hypothetical protein ACO0LC_20470 [Undibacterium sp. JH2W]|uniref:hypothetical protein n=1 Tax=Undibacterium sp. JH2W TaxID=3413037 RepID=UPI003BF2247B